MVIVVIDFGGQLLSYCTGHLLLMSRLNQHDVWSENVAFVMREACCLKICFDIQEELARGYSFADNAKIRYQGISPFVCNLDDGPMWPACDCFENLSHGFIMSVDIHGFEDGILAASKDVTCQIFYRLFAIDSLTLEKII